MSLKIFLSPSTQKNNLYSMINKKRVTEREVMNGITDLLESYLHYSDLNVTVYRNNAFLGLNAAIKKSNELKSDIHLAIHSNAGGKGKATGTEVFTAINPLSGLLAASIYKEVARVTPTDSDRGVKDGSHLVEIRKVHAPVRCLVEIDFHDNLPMADWLYSHKRIIAQALFRGIQNFINVGLTKS